MRRRAALLASVLALTLIAAACGGDDSGTSSSTTDGATGTTSGGGAAADFNACQVSDTGGIDDKSFNETAFKGITDAKSEFGVSGEFLESQAITDFRPNIDSFIAKGCDVVITVGFLLGDDTKAAAEENPDKQFAIVDYAYDPPIDNVRALVFQTDEAAFLAGYLAAGMSETGKVGTFGGVNIPTVTIFMDGFLNGVNHYNDTKDASVEVLGWNGSEGLFTGNFESTDDGRTFGNNLIGEGADIIMPVAGPVGLGTAAAAQEAGDVKIIGVDSDWYESAATYKSVVLTSVLKRMDIAVYDTIETVLGGESPGTLYNGTLENNGVDLASFHDLDGEVPQELKDEIDQLRADIISGTISVTG